VPIFLASVATPGLHQSSDYPDGATFEHVTKAYIRRRNRDHRDPGIRELEYRRRVA
jgi:hypothetical protein